MGGKFMVLVELEGGSWRTRLQHLSSDCSFRLCSILALTTAPEKTPVLGRPIVIVSPRPQCFSHFSLCSYCPAFCLNVRSCHLSHTPRPSLEALPDYPVTPWAWFWPPSFLVWATRWEAHSRAIVIYAACQVCGFNCLIFSFPICKMWRLEHDF